MLADTKIGKSGYVYIFNDEGKMIIHPDSNLENKYLNKLKNPLTDTYIYNDLVNAYNNGDKKLYYFWDKQNDKENYIYKKVSWIEYDPYFKWYICSSAYLDEFHTQSNKLKDYIIYSTIIVILLIIIIGLYFLKQILEPIIELSQNAKDVINGDLNVRYNGVISNDETGMLATQFNLMLDTLDSKIREKTDKLSKSLAEKEILLREIHHRIKNNLYIINGIIGLQSFQTKDIPVDQLLKNIQNRIQAIAMAHDMLGKKDDDYIINIKDYIETLVDSLLQAYEKDKLRYNCVYEIQSIELTIDQTLSIGLIVNELITNSIKYALKTQDNYIYISLSLKDETVMICIKDNGDGFNPAAKQGIGLEIVEMSVKQLGGIISMDFQDGTKINIKFPIDS